MPRKRIPPKLIAEAAIGKAEALREKIASVVDRRTDNVIRNLNPDVRRVLVDDLVRAVGFAMAGLPTAIAGSRAKRNAWVMDIFVRDVCDALRRAGVPALMNSDPQASLAQSLAKEVVQVAGLPDQGDLFHQMQRGGKIVKELVPPPE